MRTRAVLGRSALDAVGLALAALYALPTLAYPPARDQALFFYIAREWLHGAVPYKDVFDIKPPAIFVVNAVSILLFGLRPWGVRALELGGLLTMAWVVVAAVVRDSPRRGGEVGAVALLLVGWYFGALDWVDTAEPEFWEGLALVAAYAAATRVSSVTRAALLSGALVGVAVLFKFPAALVGLACTVAVGMRVRPWKRAALAVVIHAGAAIAVVALAASYFALSGAWGDVRDALFGYVLDYQRNSPAPPPDVARTIVNGFWFQRGWPWVAPVLGGWALTTALAVQRKAWGVVRGGGAAMALFALSFASVVIQRRFNAYYWGVTTPFFALLAAYAVAKGARSLPWAVLAGAAAVTALGWVLSPPWIFNLGGYSYRTHVPRTAQYVMGAMSRADYLRAFTGFASYDYAASERVGDLLHARSISGDQVVVRGYEPAIYVVSGLSCPSRFASDIALWQPGITYKRREWTLEYERAVWGASPRFFVGLALNPDDCARIREHGYREIARDTDFIVFERGGS